MCEFVSLGSITSYGTFPNPVVLEGFVLKVYYSEVY